MCMCVCVCVCVCVFVCVCVCVFVRAHSSTVCVHGRLRLSYQQQKKRDFAHHICEHRATHLDNYKRC